jgi:hypothetical protein
MWFLCAPTAQLVDQPCTTFSFIVGSKIHHQRPQPVGFSHIRRLELLPTNYKARKISLISLVSYKGDGPGMVYHHASTTWDELSREERKRVMGFQIGTISHAKLTRLEHNALLGRSIDLNSLTWLLVKCVLFQMYTTPALIQLACSYGDAAT